MGVPTYALRVRHDRVGPVLQELGGLLGPNFDPLGRWQGDHSLMERPDRDHLQQGWWSAALGRARLTGLLDQVSPRDQARLLEQQTSLGSAFMAVVPHSALMTSIPSDTYRLGLRWWLGLPLIEVGDQVTPVCSGCQGTVDLFGDHLLCCPRINFAVRHNALKDALAGVLREAGQGVGVEVPIPDCQDASLRPADLLLRHLHAGKDTAVDLTVAHGWQAQESATVSRERWRTFLRRKEAAKVAKYEDVCAEAGWAFLPAAFGTWGGQGPQAARLVSRCCKMVAGWHEGDLRASRQEEARQGLGLTLMRAVWSLLEAKNCIR